LIQEKSRVWRLCRATGAKRADRMARRDPVDGLVGGKLAMTVLTTHRGTRTEFRLRPLLVWNPVERFFHTTAQLRTVCCVLFGRGS
jgi:hypothetical protein